MLIPELQGIIERRILANYRVDADVAASLLPGPFRPKLVQGSAIAGVCLIKLRDVRPQGIPSSLGINSENAAHRIAVEWVDRDGSEHEGVFIWRRDTGSRINALAGGRVFPGRHARARIDSSDNGQSIAVDIRSGCGGSLRIKGERSQAWPAGSVFGSRESASEFFERGSVGFSPAREQGAFDGLKLSIDDWRAEPFAVDTVESSFFDDRARFPEGSIAFDHALLMTDVVHHWRSARNALPTGPRDLGS